MQKFENVDVLAALEQIMRQHTAFYQNDFDIDKSIIHRDAASDQAVDKALLWMSRPSGTYCFRERDVFLKGTRQHNTWKFYGEQTRDKILAYAVELTGTQGGTIRGNLYELDYQQHFRHVVEASQPVSVNRLFYEHGTRDIPDGQYFDGSPDRVLGNFLRYEAQPHDPAVLQEALRQEQHSRGRAVPGDFKAHVPYYTEILLLVWVLAIVAFSLFMSRMKEIHSSGFWHILPCALMLPIFFYSAVEIRRWPQGLAVLIFVTLGCTVNDVGAYFVGRAVGTHKLAPIISPGKTVEGGLGGMVSSVILMSLIASLYSQCAGVEIRYGWLFLYLFLASIVGQFGDLAMSTIKRTVGIKDFSRVLPGHGGILDRFDSFLFAAPFAVLYGNMTGCFL